MLTIEEIINFLGVVQKRVDCIYQTTFFKNNSINILSLPNEILELHDTFKECYYISNNGNFYDTFLSLIDPNFNSSLNQSELIKELRKKLWEDLDKAFKDYGYNRKRKFNKIQFQTELLKFEDSNVNDQIIKYLSDYFSINIYIIDNITRNINTYLATDDSDMSCVFKPCIIIYLKDNKYYPITKKNNRGLFIYSKDGIVQDIYNRFVPGKLKPLNNIKTNKTENKLEDNVDNKNDKKNDIKEEEIKKYPTTKMSIAELQGLAKEYDLDIMKKKGEKEINKTKKELYDEINIFLNKA